MARLVGGGLPWLGLRPVAGRGVARLESLHARVLQNGLDPDPAVKWNAARFILAAMHLLYYNARLAF